MRDYLNAFISSRAIAINVYFDICKRRDLPVETLHMADFQNSSSFQSQVNY